MSNQDKLIHPTSKLNQYEKVKSIGSNGFGKTFLCERKHDGLQVCLKFINYNKLENSGSENMENEVMLLKKLNHQNIVKYIEHFNYKNYMVIVMEYID
jgi:NIMA (never in mitosis gene a)-related kinase